MEDPVSDWTLITEPSAAGNQYSAGGIATAPVAASPTQYPTPPPGLWTPELEIGNAGNVPLISLPSSGGLSFNGDLVLTTIGSGVIVLSPTGLTAWRIGINDPDPDGIAALYSQQVFLSIFSPVGQWQVIPELSDTGNDYSVEQNNGPLYNVLSGDLNLTFPGSGVILFTPGGFGPYRMGVADDGAADSQTPASPSGPQVPVPIVVMPTGAWGLLAELNGTGNRWSLDTGGYFPPGAPILWGQDFLINAPGAGVVCACPTSGHSYRIGVDDSGAIFTQQVS